MSRVLLMFLCLFSWCEAAPGLMSTLQGFGEYATSFLSSPILAQQKIYNTWRDSRQYVMELNQQIQATNQVADMTAAVNEFNAAIYERVSTVQSKMYEKSVKMTELVSDVYRNITFNTTNFRFQLIPDEIKSNNSVVQNICVLTRVTCDECHRLMKVLFCQVCCGDQQSVEPVTLLSAQQQESGSLLTYQSNQWIYSVLEWLGLKAVYQSWFPDRQQYDTEDIMSIIQSFQWKNNNEIMANLLVKAKGAIAAYGDIGEGSGGVARDRMGLRSQDICGYYVQDKAAGRIMGGTPVAKNGAYPWQLSLSTGFFGFFYQHRCGASLLTKYWVLTASHCMRTLSVETTYVMGGFLAINNKNTAQIRRISKVFMNEKFIPDLYEQDIALLRLRDPMTYSATVLPICLPNSDTTDYVSTLATLTGWGRQWNDGPLADQLMQVKLPVISNQECMAWYESSGSKQYIPDYTFLCAGYKNGSMDACSGDSGGPLISFRSDKRAEVIGVVSWGIGCGVKERPGVYTRVTKFLEWMRNIMAENTPEGEIS